MLRTWLRHLQLNPPRHDREQRNPELATPWNLRRRAHDDVDLIVIGLHGYGTLDRILGTTAAKVTNHTDRNVLVIRTSL